ncbi:hypothetical protein IEO70_15415 [Bacillus sp. AGMB 02131]|uniref:Uncharacterized protein n=1 Tax=Peribacillus faecalis TaxID=2772559 RepID=A0A927CXV2_9BACI|nr:hypothetical protein [Peribacillus faecalis]MBD3109727.1 hypothetical protein [Peribacillus faecalis]
MKLIKCRGYELIKAQPNTPEDFFTRSEVIFNLEGEERTLHVLYVAFFENEAKTVIPYSEDLLFKAGNQEYFLRDIVALIYLLHHPQGTNRKRIYVNEQSDFLEYLKNTNFKEIESMIQQLDQR